MPTRHHNEPELPATFSHNLLILLVKEQVQENAHVSFAHILTNIRDSVQESEALLASLGVDACTQMSVCLMSWIQNSGSSRIAQASTVVADMPHIEHVVQAFQSLRH
jgi:hypothetical protein